MHVRAQTRRGCDAGSVGAFGSMMEDNGSLPSETWLLVGSDDVPEPWNHRSMHVTVVRLSPEEAKRLLSGGNSSPDVGPGDEELAHLVASGLGAAEIGKHLHLTTRSVYRRLARLRERAGVETIGELAAKLSRLGY